MSKLAHGKSQALNPLYIRVRADDNVAVVVNQGGLHAGSEFANGFRLLEQIPQGHKVALEDISAGDPIRRYGEVIGHAATSIGEGSWVKESLVLMPEAPSLVTCPLPAVRRLYNRRWKALPLRVIAIPTDQ